MSSTPRKSLFGNFFKGVLERLTRADAVPSPADDPLAEVAEAEAAAWREMHAAEKRLEAERGIDARPEEDAHHRALRAREEKMLEERQALRDRMEDDIAGWHERLESGLTRADMHRLRQVVLAHAPKAEQNEAEFEDRVEEAVLGVLHQKVGELSWRDLELLMERAGVSFPVPSGMAHGRDQAELEPFLRQHHAELKDAFLAMPPDRVALLVCGEVPGWSHLYPEPEAALWVETCLRAVGAALRARLFERAVELWLQRPPEVTQHFSDVLRGHLAEVRATLQRGVSSLSETRRLSEEIARGCQEIVPQLVWEYVEERLASEAPGARHEKNEERPYLDPVCGMYVSHEEKCHTAERDGAVYFFCSAVCCKKFAADPARYLATNR